MDFDQLCSRNLDFPDLAPIREAPGLDMVTDALSAIAQRDSRQLVSVVEQMAASGIIVDGQAFLNRMRSIVSKTLLYPDEGMGPLEWITAALYQVAGSDHPLHSIEQVSLDDAQVLHDRGDDQREQERASLLDSFRQRGCTIDHAHEQGTDLLILQIPLYKRDEMAGVVVLTFIENAWTPRLKRSALDFAVVQLNNRCNLLCPGCYMGKTSEMPPAIRQQVISSQDIQVLLKAFPTLRYAALVGGEPLLEWEALQNTVALFRAHPLTKGIFLSSNTLHLNEEQAAWIGNNIDSMAGKWNVGSLDDPRLLDQPFVATLPDHLQAVIHNLGLSTRGELYQELQGYLLTGLWGQRALSRQMEASIRKFRNHGLEGSMRRDQWRLENFLRAENLAPGIIEDWLEFCFQVGAYPEPEMMSGSLATLTRGTGGWQENLPDQELVPVPVLADMFKRVFARHGMADKLPEHWTPPYIVQPCVMKDRTFYVSPGGVLSVCPSQSASIGNYYTDTPGEIAAHPLLLARLILQHNSQYLLGEPCGSCRALTVCKGGCRPGVEIITGNPFAGTQGCGFYQPADLALGRVSSALAGLRMREYQNTRTWQTQS